MTKLTEDNKCKVCGKKANYIHTDQMGREFCCRKHIEELLDMESYR